MDGHRLGFRFINPAQFNDITVSLPMAANQSDTPSQKTDIYKSSILYHCESSQGFCYSHALLIYTNQPNPNCLEETQQSPWLLFARPPSFEKKKKKV